MLKQIRQSTINSLWESYRHTSSQVRLIEDGLKRKGIQTLPLDHFAIIDLPGPNTGIPHLQQIFSALGYTTQGGDYLPEKQNDFLWMAEADSNGALASDPLPQVVVADFRLDELPPEIRAIIEKYSRQAPASLLADIQQWIQYEPAKLNTVLVQYFSGRDWPLPSVSEFRTVDEFNELLAWVLVFGRRPNHFTISAHLLNCFTNLEEFHHFIEQEIQLPLNREGGEIKGSQTAGIAQGSTEGISRIVKLSDGIVQLPTDFVEFVWRYPHNPACVNPQKWDDYFTGFVANHANRVIESLY